MTNETLPTMTGWETAWLEKDRNALIDMYASDGVVIPPNQLKLQGGNEIVGWFGEGVGSIEVRFFPEKQIQAGELAYEFGMVRDFELHSDTIVEICHYSVTWILTDGVWKIQLHTWTVPIEE